MIKKYKIHITVAGSCMGCPTEQSTEYFETDSDVALFQRIDHINKNWASVSAVEEVPTILARYREWKQGNDNP